MSYSPDAPRTGLAALFSMAGRPTELKVSFWIWFIGGVLGLLGGLLGMMAALVLFAAAPGIAMMVLLLLLLAAGVGAAQIVFALKMKDGRRWARLALTVLMGATGLLALANVLTEVGQDGNWVSFLISLGATVLMWLPRPQQWFFTTGAANASAE